MKDKGMTLNPDTNDLNVKVTYDSRGLITGGFVVGDITRQNQALIIYMQPGEMKEAPQMGVGIDSMLLSSDTLLYKHKIREQLEADGLRVNLLDMEIIRDKINIQINAVYQ